MRIKTNRVGDFEHASYLVIDIGESRYMISEGFGTDKVRLVINKQEGSLNIHPNVSNQIEIS